MRVFNGVKLFDPPEHAWYGKPGEKFDVVLASDYAASVDRLTSDKARLAVELAMVKEQYASYREAAGASIGADLNQQAIERISALEAAARQLLSLVANKGQPMSHPDNQALYAAGDTITVNEGNLWNLQMVLGSVPETGGKLLRRMPGIDDLIESAAVEIKDALSETFAEPGIGPIEPEPQDYKVQCRCGWMGQVSALKSLPEFKMGCPDCSAEFVPLNRMTFPVKTKGEQGG